MCFSYFIGLCFFVCIAIIGAIASLGWMRESRKRELLEGIVRGLVEKILEQQDEIKRLESWASIQKANEGVDFDVDR